MGGHMQVVMVSRALHVRLFLANLGRALLIFNGVRSPHCQRALLVYHYPHQSGPHGTKERQTWKHRRREVPRSPLRARS